MPTLRKLNKLHTHTKSRNMKILEILKKIELKKILELKYSVKKEKRKMLWRISIVE